MSSLSRTCWIGIASNLAALVCILVAFMKQNDELAGGAYFNVSIGVSDVRPWLIAAGCLLLLGTAALVVAMVQRSE